MSTLYTRRLEQLNIDASVHRTRLKEQILARISELEPDNQRREVWFAYSKNFRTALTTAFENNDALVLVKAARTGYKETRLSTTLEFTDLTQETRKEA